MTKDKMIELKKRVLEYAGMEDVTPAIVKMMDEKGSIDVEIGLDGKEYLWFSGGEQWNEVYLDIETEKVISRGRAMDVFAIPCDMPEQEIKAKKTLLKSAGIYEKWLEVHFNEICETNEDDFVMADQSGRQYIRYRKTGLCAWFDTGELIKTGELSEFEADVPVYEKYNTGDYVVVGVPYRYL